MVKTPKLNPRLINKILLTVLLLTALAGIAGSHLAPRLPLFTVLFYSALGVLAAAAVLLVVMVVSLTVSQWILRNGGTDTQWFWFSGEPPGLQKLRAEAHALDHKDRA
jgi:hypothetical protein